MSAPNPVPLASSQSASALNVLNDAPVLTSVHGTTVTLFERWLVIVCAHSAVETGGFSSGQLLPELLVDVCAAPVLVLARDDELAED